LIVARTTSQGPVVPKAVAIVLGLGLVVGLAVTAPGHAATPSAAASRIVGAYHHKKPIDGRHRTEHGLRR
jgi:hypothetical protein